MKPFENIYFPNRYYASYKPIGKDCESFLGFITPYTTNSKNEPDSQTKKRTDTVDRWVGRSNVSNTKIHENKLRSGFCLGKSVRRFTTNNVLLRVTDPWGFDLEISIENLAYLLIHTSIDKGEIGGKLRWARYGSVNWLLVSGTELYQQAMNNTKAEDSRASIKDVNVGDVVNFYKKGRDATYLGRFYKLDVDRGDLYRDGSVSKFEIENNSLYHTFLFEPIDKSSSLYWQNRYTILLQKSPKIGSIRPGGGLPCDKEKLGIWINDATCGDSAIFIDGHHNEDYGCLGVSDVKVKEQATTLEHNPNPDQKNIIRFNGRVIKGGYRGREDNFWEGGEIQEVEAGVWKYKEAGNSYYGMSKKVPIKSPGLFYSFFVEWEAFGRTFKKAIRIW